MSNCNVVSTSKDDEKPTGSLCMWVSGDCGKGVHAHMLTFGKALVHLYDLVHVRRRFNDLKLKSLYYLLVSNPSIPNTIIR